MVSQKQNGVNQYTHTSATRLSLATQETALSLTDEELEEDEYTQVTPSSERANLGMEAKPER